MHRYVFLVLFSFLLACGESENLYQQFQNPPQDARPFVRWWWNGNCVEENEILRELDVMKKAGIGGIEINPIAMPKDATDINVDCIKWGTPEWSQMVKFAADAAAERDMITDIIIGTGWPFGGQFLQPDEQIKGVVINKVDVEGPALFEANLSELTKIIKRGHVNQPDPELNPPAPDLMFIKLVPKNINRIDQCIDVTGNHDAGGQINVQVPAGKYQLMVGSLHRGVGFRTVTNGAPGADGPCLDHFSKEAVTRYCDRLANTLEPALGGQLGTAIRALFVDSIELSGSNWTTGFPEIFKEKCGYDPEPYYPFIFYQDTYEGYEQPVTNDPDFQDTIQRVRYDYSKTLVEVFLDRFTRTYHDWCHEHGTQSRYQAYGTPWLMGMSEGYMIPDIPESNNWLYSPDAYTHGYNVWNKYTSSSGHLQGRKIMSCEAMTNTRGVFQTTLETIKQADDLNFIMGINHSVLHGFNYSPPEAGFPGWVRYGAYFSDQNTWWPYFRLWADYNARISAVLQASEPVVDFAILTPKADVWSTAGLARVPFHLTPWYGHRLWEPIHQTGCSADYINEKVLQDADFGGGRINCGPMQYSALILTDVKSLEPGTAKALADYANSGGKIVFVDAVPSRSPSFLNAKENDQIVRSSLDKVLQDHEQNVVVVSGPADKEDMISWIQQVYEKIQFQPTVALSSPQKSVYQIHQQYADKDIFFFVNSDMNETATFKATFSTGNKIPWIWDPASGERRVYPVQTAKNELTIKLLPVESLLLVFEPKHKGSSDPVKQVDRSSFQQLSMPWQCEFRPVQSDSFERTLTRLTDLAQSADIQLNTFAGDIIYKAEFEPQSDQNLVLDLGRVEGISEISLNGKKVGVRWWGNHTYDIANHVRSGQNDLQIKITTVLLNYVKSLNDNPTAQTWTKNQTRVSVGLLGPVRLYKKQ